MAKMERFCRAYLRTMDPERAALEAGCRDGFAQLAAPGTQKRLERMREAAAGQLRREDVLRRLAQLAFGQANDGVKLAMQGQSALAEGLDLSAVAEIRVTDKGGVEIKFVDRVRALETLCELLGGQSGAGAEELFRALSAAGAEEEGAWEHGGGVAVFPQAAAGTDLVVPAGAALGGYHLRRSGPKRQDLFYGAVLLPVGPGLL